MTDMLLDNTKFDYFSGTRPDLVNKHVLKDINKLLSVKYKEPQNCVDGIVWCYTSFIYPNMFSIIIVIILVLFLLYRYMAKKYVVGDNSIPDDVRKDLETYTDVNSDKDEIYGDNNDSGNNNADSGNNGTNGTTARQGDNRYSKHDHLSDLDIDTPHFRPTFNPYYPTNMQSSYVNYLPDEVPLSVSGRYVNNSGNSGNDISARNPGYTPYPSKIQNDDIYTGSINTYAGAHNPMHPNSLGWEADYNTTTNDALNFATRRNRQNLNQLSEILYNNPNKHLQKYRDKSCFDS